VGTLILYPIPEICLSLILGSIVAVPGLNCAPEASWKSPNGFNWLEHKDGLQKAIPASRIMLFAYNSAYGGRYAVDTCMIDIGHSLLHALMSMREVRNELPALFNFPNLIQRRTLPDNDH
jgi:hypothetical protein